MNFVDPILFQCGFQPNAPAIVIPGGNAPVSYGQLGGFIESVASVASDKGLVRGQTVALTMSDQLLHIAVMLGLARMGVVTVSANLQQIPASLKLDAILSDAKDDRVSIVVDQDWLTRAVVQDSSPSPSTARDYCRLILSSGTTGDSKAIALRQEHVFRRVSRLQAALGGRLGLCSRIYSDVGVTTGIGFAVILHTLWKGSSLVVGKYGPEPTIRSCFAHGVQAMFASPKGIADLLGLRAAKPEMFKRFELIVSMGSVLNRNLLSGALKDLCDEVYSIYGSSELGPIATAPSEVLAQAESVAGFVASDLHIDVLDENDQPVSAGVEGRIRVKGEQASEGYVNGMLGDIDTFSPEGFCSGDMGVLTEDGLLLIKGRENTVINLGGNKISPEKVERALLAYPPIKDAGVFNVESKAGIDKIVGAIVWNQDVDLEPARRGLHDHLQAKLTPAQIPRLFVEIDQIPHNQMGKIDRAELKARGLDMLKKTEEANRQRARAR